MAALRTLCASLGLRDVQTYIQSGNLVFREDGEDPVTVARRLEKAIETSFGFRPAVIVRTASEMRKVIAKNPFAGRTGIEPNRLLVVFMDSTPTKQAREQLLEPALRAGGTAYQRARSSISTIPREWLIRRFLWSKLRRRCNAHLPAGTGTPSTSYWLWLRSWKARSREAGRERPQISPMRYALDEGHGFTRAVKASQRMRASAPERHFRDLEQKAYLGG